MLEQGNENGGYRIRRPIFHGNNRNMKLKCHSSYLVPKTHNQSLRQGLKAVASKVNLKKHILCQQAN
jgi:hypothetical protein